MGWFRRNFLKVFFGVCMVTWVASGAPNPPRAEFYTSYLYGLIVAGLAIIANFTSFAAFIGYAVTRSEPIEKLVEIGDGFDALISTLTSPSKWGTAALLGMLIYYASQMSGYPDLTKALLVMSIATTMTAGMAVVQCFHLMTTHLTVALKGMILQDKFGGDLFEMLSKMCEEEETKEEVEK